MIPEANLKTNKIHLVSFAAEYRGVEDTTIPPAGCLYVGGALKQAGFHVTVHHINSKDIQKAAQKICRTNPLFVGFSVITGSPVVHSATMSRMLKKISPDVPIVWGGIHPSLIPELCLCENFVDYVAIGEGEEVAVALANTLSTGEELSTIPNIGYKDNDGEITINRSGSFIKDLDQYKQDWSLLDPKHYIRTSLDGKRYFAFISSRGCPYNCGFCYNQIFNKRRWRGHSAEFVINEIKKLKKITGIEYVTFNDDNFLVNKKRAIKILKGLREIGVTATWIEVRLDQFDEEILAKLVDYGVKTLFVGWESGSNNTLKKIDKGFDTELILKSFKMAAKYSLEIDASAIVGFPFENEEDIKQTIKMVEKIDDVNPGKNKFNIGVYMPYPGTKIVDEAIQLGFRFPRDINLWGEYDIVKGEMNLPWLEQKQIKRISKIDRYGKMLYTGSPRRSILFVVQKLFATLAKIRFKYSCFLFPVEAHLYDLLVRLYLKFRISSIKKN
jgi:anaerobic magnesium-protoporphyrin IX monomethyl ester cyclase